MRILKEITILILFLDIAVRYYSEMLQPALAEQPWWVNLIPIPIYRPLRLHLANVIRSMRFWRSPRNEHPMWGWSLSGFNNGESTPSRLTPGRDYHLWDVFVDGWSGSNCSQTIITFIEWSRVNQTEEVKCSSFRVQSLPSEFKYIVGILSFIELGSNL